SSAHVPALTEGSTLSLHVALPISMRHVRRLMDLDHARPAADGHSPEAMFRPTRWPVSLKQVVESVEKQLISLALEENQGDRMKRSEEHTSELQSREKLVCRRLLEK